MYDVPIYPCCVGGLQVALAAFVLPIVVSYGAVSLLEIIEEPPLELVPPL